MFGSMDVIDNEGFGADRDEGPLRLGTRHLTENGLCHQWLIRLAADAHIGGLSRALGQPRTRFTDSGGEAIRPVFVQMSVSGNSSGFHEDDSVLVRHAVSPSPVNGYRSALVISAEDEGACATVSMVSRFVRWAGPSNTDLIRAEPAARTIARGRQPIRHPALSVSGNDEIVTSAFSVRICPETHLNCFGLVSLAAFAACFSQGERSCSNIATDGAALLLRELVCLGNIDPGDHLDIASVSRPGAVAGATGIVSKSWARRRSDSKLIAASLSVRDAQ